MKLAGGELRQSMMSFLKRELVSGAFAAETSYGEQKFRLPLRAWGEELANLETARLRERAIKGQSRAHKEKLINEINKLWRNLYYEASISERQTQL